MDVKPRPLSCMKKLSLTCEIKLQIHRPGIEKTLPAGPRGAGSSPAGLAGPGRDAEAAALPVPGLRAFPPRCPRWPEARALPLRGPAHDGGHWGEALGRSEAVLQGEEGERQGAGQHAAEMGGCPEQQAGTSRRTEIVGRDSGRCPLQGTCLP